MSDIDKAAEALRARWEDEAREILCAGLAKLGGYTAQDIELAMEGVRPLLLEQLRNPYPLPLDQYQQVTEHLARTEARS